MDVLDGGDGELVEKPRRKNSDRNKWYPDKYPGLALLLSRLETNGRRTVAKKLKATPSINLHIQRR